MTDQPREAFEKWWQEFHSDCVHEPHVKGYCETARQARGAAEREEFSKECERFHNEGHKCATCGRIDLEEIERQKQAEREAGWNEGRDAAAQFMDEGGWHESAKAIRALSAPAAKESK